MKHRTRGASSLQRILDQSLLVAVLPLATWIFLSLRRDLDHVSEGGGVVERCVRLDDAARQTGQRQFPVHFDPDGRSGLAIDRIIVLAVPGR